MIVGVPRAIDTNQNRVALVPAGAEALAGHGHRVVVERGAGLGSGFADDRYVTAGAELVPDASAMWRQAELVCTVKEPVTAEWPLLRRDQVVFTSFHFAGDEALTNATFPCARTLAALGRTAACRDDAALRAGLDIVAGKVVYPAVAEAFGLPLATPESVL
jgi:alanine dehydrogenase